MSLRAQQRADTDEDATRTCGRIQGKFAGLQTSDTTQHWSSIMPKIRTAIKMVAFALGLSWIGACGGSYYNGYYDNYPYYYTGYGAYTIVHRPRVVVDGWTGRVWRYRPYRGYRVRVHHSPVTVYQATKGDETLEVALTEVGSDSTRVEVKARRGENGWDKDRAKQLLSSIMSQDRDAAKANKKKKNAAADH